MGSVKGPGVSIWMLYYQVNIILPFDLTWATKNSALEHIRSEILAIWGMVDLGHFDYINQMIIVSVIK